MRPWNLERKLVVGVLALFLIPTLVAGAILWTLYRRGIFADARALALTVVIGLAAMMAYLGFMAHAIGRSLVRTLQEIQRGTEVMATVNPEHRHRVQTGDELESVAEEINRMADRVRDARLGLEAEVARATRELHLERAKLSAILDELDEGVLVATLDGRLSLANRAAQELLGGGGILGRSLFDFVDREKVTHFRDRLQASAGAAERFTLHPAVGAVLQAGMTSFVDEQGRMTGFVLALRDESRPAREEEAQQRALADALRELRGSLASIRSLSESLLGGLGEGDAAHRPSLAAIHAEALRLSALVTEMAGGERLGLARAPRHSETIAVGDLFAMALRRLRSEGGDPETVHVGEVPPEIPSLQGEVSALSVALVSMLKAALARQGAGTKAWLRPVRRGGVLQIEVGAEGSGVVSDLEGCLDIAVQVGPVGRLTVREIVRRHAGEAWAYADAGRLGFRFTVPVDAGRSPIAPPDGEAASALRLVGAGTVSGFGPGEPRPERPQLYDFSLFEQMERHLLPADRERALDELTFVAFDTETTGLRPEDGDRIVSLAAVKVRGGAVKRSECFDALVNPGRAVPAESARFHGITEAMLAGAPAIDLVLPAFQRFAEGAVLVGHEVWFDLAFLSREADRMGLPPLTVSHPILDTRLLSRVVHGSAPDHTLDATALRLGVTIQGRHSALGDALATAEVLARLLELLKKRGIVTLGQALDAARGARGRGSGPHDAAGVRA